MAHGKPYLVMEPSRMMTRRFGIHIVNGIREEELRVQKALTLLKTRDRQIACLEKRVFELEKAAANLHAMSLRASQTITNVETLDNETSYLSASGTEKTISRRHQEDPEEGGQTVASVDLKDEDTSRPIEERDRSIARIPNLVFSYLRKDEFSMPVVDCTKSESFLDVLRNEGFKSDFSKTESNEPSTSRRAKNQGCKKILSEITGEIPSVSCPTTLIVATSVPLHTKNETFKNSSDEPRTLRRKKPEVKPYTNLEDKIKSNYLGRTSFSVPWINRKKRYFRGKIRGLDWRIRQVNRDLGATEPGTVAVTTRTFSETHKKHEADNKMARYDAQEAQVIPDPENVNKKQNISTQTSDEMNLELIENPKEKSIIHTSTSYTCLEQKKSFVFFNTNENLAGQCLNKTTVDAENEFNKNNQLNESAHITDVNENDVSLKFNYEKIISELEEKVTDIKSELEETYEENRFIKEKYKTALENAKLEAVKQSEIMQGKIVQMCTSVLKKFGPYSLSPRKTNRRYSTSQRHLKSYKKRFRKLNRKLKIVASTSEKVNEELVATRKNLEEKSRKYDTLNKYFAKLKLELETTEVNLNDLIKENRSLRKMFEAMKEWMKTRVDKNENTQLRDTQRDGNLTSLTKINYKNQLANIVREKDEFVSRYKELEQENNLPRINGAQLKTKLETKLTLKYEQSMLHETNMLTTKCDEVVEVKKTKVSALENRNAQYFAVI